MHFMAVKKSRKQVLVSDLFIFKRRCIYRDTETTVVLSEFTCKIVFTKKNCRIGKPSDVLDELDILGLPIRKGKAREGPLGKAFQHTEREKNKQTNNFARSRGIPRSLVI